MIPAAATATLAVVFATPFGLYAAQTWREWPWGVHTRYGRVMTPRRQQAKQEAVRVHSEPRHRIQRRGATA